MRQQDLADAVGVSRSAVTQWETGRTEPSASKMFAIARATSQPLDWFAEGLTGDVVRPKGLEPLTF
ncbi:helix-turn-helix transcriptional regulator [Microbacterium sp. PAMC21962]